MVIDFNFLEIESKLKFLEKSINRNVNKVVEKIERVFSVEYQQKKINAKRDELLAKLEQQLINNISNASHANPMLELYFFKISSNEFSKIEFLYLNSRIFYLIDHFSFYKKLSCSHLFNWLRHISFHYDFEFTEKYKNYMIDNDKCLVMDSAAKELKLVNRKNKFCMKKISIQKYIYSSQVILFKNKIGLIMHKDDNKFLHIFLYLFDYNLNIIRRKNFTQLIPSLYKYVLAYKHTESEELVLEFNFIDYFKTKSGLECQTANRYFIIDLEFNIKNSFTMKVERHVNKKFNSLLNSGRRVRSMEGKTIDLLATDNSLVKKIYLKNEILQMFLDNSSNIYLISNRHDGYVISCFNSNGELMFEKKLKNICDSFEMYEEKLYLIKNRKPIAVL